MKKRILLLFCAVVGFGYSNGYSGCTTPSGFMGGTCPVYLRDYGVCVDIVHGSHTTPYEVEQAIDSFLVSATNTFGYQAKRTLFGLRIKVHPSTFQCPSDVPPAECAGTGAYSINTNLLQVFESDCIGATAIHHELIHVVQYKLQRTVDWDHRDGSLFKQSWDYCGALPLDLRSWLDGCWRMCDPMKCRGMQSQIELQRSKAECI